MGFRLPTPLGSHRPQAHNDSLRHVMLPRSSAAQRGWHVDIRCSERDMRLWGVGGAAAGDVSQLDVGDEIDFRCLETAAPAPPTRALVGRAIVPWAAVPMLEPLGRRRTPNEGGRCRGGVGRRWPPRADCASGDFGLRADRPHSSSTIIIRCRSGHGSGCRVAPCACVEIPPECRRFEQPP